MLFSSLRYINSTIVSIILFFILALRYFRQKDDVIADIEEMETETDENDTKEESYTMKQLLQTSELRMPLIIACMLQVIQQLSGINAVCIN